MSLTPELSPAEMLFQRPADKHRRLCQWTRGEMQAELTDRLTDTRLNKVK